MDIPLIFHRYSIEPPFQMIVHGSLLRDVASPSDWIQRVFVAKIAVPMISHTEKEEDDDVRRAPMCVML